jgi:xanthine dehydrogenase accessory factor
MAAGLICAGNLQVLIHPAGDLSPQAWALLAVREPICLVTDLSGHNVGRTTWCTLETLITPGPSVEHGIDRLDGYRAQIAVGSRQGPEVLGVFGRGTTATEVVQLSGIAAPKALVNCLWPAQRLVLVGPGLLAAALDQAASLLAWECLTIDDAAAAARMLPQLRCSDALIVLTNDLTSDGLLLLAALRSPVGYVGALGSGRTHHRRVRWLTEHGIDPRTIAGLRGPVGLDIGARTPPEIAVAIVAEILAVRSGVLDPLLARRADAGWGDQPPPGRVPRSRSEPR